MLQAKVAAHRKMLKDLDNTRVRSRLKGSAWYKPGWYATHAEQLRDWLGEFLLSKYEHKQQMSRSRYRPRMDALLTLLMLLVRLMLRQAVT